jgi:membrane protease YdiL (CAAX protease family)
MRNHNNADRGPFGLLRVLTARPALEPLAFVALGVAYAWVIQPTGNSWIQVPFMTVIVLIPLASNFLHGDKLHDMGIRFDNLWSSTREVGVVTLLATGLVVVVGYVVGAGPAFPRGILGYMLFYPLWGLVQQYAMQSFAFRRTLESVERPWLSAAITALLFAVLHWPNWPLALLTGFGGFVWCLLFYRQPNLFILALSHGWLAVLIRYSWPAEWLRNLRIGPSYWTWMP